MKLWKIFSFEFAYHLGRVSTWFYFATLLTFTFVMNQVTTPGDGVYANNTFNITGFVVIGGLIWLVIGASIAGEAAARDVQTLMHPLTYTTPVKKLDYLGGRFLAAFAVNSILVLSLPLGMMLYFYFPGLEQDGLLPFRPTAYLSVFFLIALPNAFVATALQFTFAAFGRRVMTSYLASLLLAIFPQVIAITAASFLMNLDLIKLLDPVGVAGIIGSEMGTWTVTEKNTRLVTLDGMFLWNRVLWLSVATGLLLLTYLHFSFNNPVLKSWKSRFKWLPEVKVRKKEEAAKVIATAISVSRVQGRFGFTTYFSQAIAIAWASFVKIARHPLGLTLVGAFALVSALFGSLIISEFSIPLIPTTQQVLAYLTAPVSNVNTPWVVIPLLIMYFVGELVWHERDKGLNVIIDAAPVPEWVFLTGKFLGLSLVIVAWMALLITGGIMMQLNLDYNKLEIGLYLQVLFGLQLIDYLLFAFLVLIIHVIVNQKYIGYLVVLLVFSFMAFPYIFKVGHSMLIFGADPGWEYTDMRGFGSTLGPWLWFKIYWIAWCLLLAVAAKLFWVRGSEQSLKYRLQIAHRRFTRSTKRIAIIGAGLLLTLGSFIYYNTNMLNEYLTDADIIERKAEYERRFGKYRNTPQPQLRSTKLHAEIYPDRQQIEIMAEYILVNNDTVPIDSIHIGSISGIKFSAVTFNRPAVGVLIDNKLSHQIYALEKQLRPGDSLKLNFEVHYKQNGFRHSGANELVVENGTCFTNTDLLPSIGYQRNREINDAADRKKYKLTKRPAIPSLFDQEARNKPFSTDNDAFEAIIGTAKDEVAVAPGILHKTWTENDRRYFHFKTDTPIWGEYSILSASYAVRESKWNDVIIRIYYHPDHALNIDRILGSAKASLEYYTEQFGPYPYGHLTIAERAGAGGGASSEASMIDYGEQYSLMNPDESVNGFDLPYYILAHEVAHQWWGVGRLSPAYVEGAGVLIEGLAVYSGMQILEKKYGDGHLQQYINYLHSFYEMPRSLATASLLQADETFLYYRKGGLAMYALSKYIGKEKVNEALHQLLQKHNSGNLPLPTTLDLYKELQKVTPDSLNYLLHDLFNENTYWRLKTKQFTAEQTKEGTWLVTLKLQAQKVVVDSTGYQNEVPMNDWLEVGIYDDSNDLNKPLYLQMHRIRSGEQTIKVTVLRRPVRGGIDPNYLMIDIRRDDNIMRLDGE